MSRRPLTLLAPLRVEARALRAGGGRRVVVTGMGPTAAMAAVVRPSNVHGDGAAVAIAGFGGALAPGIVPGDVVVASELRGAGTTVRLATSPLVAAALRRAGLRVHTGPVVSVDHIVSGAERARLAARGAVAVDMESAWLASAAGNRPLAVVRAVVDTPTHELRSPGSVIGGIRAYRALRAAADVLERWAASTRARTVVLAGPRSFCAGVVRAVEVVERALDRFGPPVYVRRQIIHNGHVVAGLEARGAIFVDELDQVPEGATTIFAAHGVAPCVRADASRRQLRVIDATCPLVAKVHAEARHFAERGYTIVLVGHRDHEEVEGTLGEAPHAIEVLATPDDVDDLAVDDPDRVAYLSQTTLAVDEVAATVERLRHRFPALVGPRTDDICYATQNRQDAVRVVAAECDLILVVGSPNSSNSNRLAEVARRQGCAAYLIDSVDDLDVAWLEHAGTVGITAGASAPEFLVDDVVAALGSLGPLTVIEREVTTEDVHFALPREVR